jgi:hypothetical protein
VVEIEAVQCSSARNATHADNGLTIGGCKDGRIERLNDVRGKKELKLVDIV